MDPKYNITSNFIVDKTTLQDKTLEDFIVKDGDVFMVEMRFGETWPRDSLLQDGERKDSGANSNPKDWRNFEVGDRIDILDVSKCFHNCFRTMSGRSVLYKES